jgi:hypothetical protein
MTAGGPFITQLPTFRSARRSVVTCHSRHFAMRQNKTLTDTKSFLRSCRFRDSQRQSCAPEAAEKIFARFVRLASYQCRARALTPKAAITNP